MHTNAMAAFWAEVLMLPASTDASAVIPTAPTMNWQQHIPSERLMTATTNDQGLHTNGPHQEEVASAHLLNQVQTGEGGCDVHRIGDDLDNKGILETSVLEVLS